MIKERIPISGDLKSRVKQLMEYAGWYEERKVDISPAEQYYADHGVPMMKATQRFYQKYFGLCCQWYLAQKKLNWAADFEFALFPYLINGIKNHLEDAYFRDMSGCELAEIEQAAGEKCQPIGHIGYYYPAEVWISEYGKLYAKYEYQDDIECFSDVFALIERDLRQCKFDSAAMKTIEALVYIDPPYYVKGSMLYLNHYSHEDHVSLSRTIMDLRLRWILSYDDAPEIKDIYKWAIPLEFEMYYSTYETKRGRELFFTSKNLELPNMDVKPYRGDIVHYC